VAVLVLVATISALFAFIVDKCSGGDPRAKNAADLDIHFDFSLSEDQ